MRDDGTGSLGFVRLDDVVAGRASVLDGADRAPAVLVANRLDEVVPVLRAVDEATVAGRWAAGFVSYEAATALDPALPTRRAAPGEPCGELPLAWFGLFAPPREVAPLEPAPGTRAPAAPHWRPGWEPPGYLASVATIRERIASGAAYQCNLTVRLHATVRSDLLELYRNLALAQGGAYNAYLDTGRFVVASASPELFFEWSDDRITTRPMKGTTTRGRFPAEDAVKAAWLAESAKDRAENVMIVDLLRSDLGKIATWGSVEATRLCELERFETLWQLTSTVVARPRPDTSLLDIFRALFPCGSVTGAPKRAAMELICELEESRRGVYCGAVGIVAPPGGAFRARFNVAIRTVVVDRDAATAVYGTGGGITWDSTAGAELAELTAKAAILYPRARDVALVETMAVVPGAHVRNLDGHLARLERSASCLGFPHDPERVRSAITAAVRGTREPCVARVVLDRSGQPTVELGPFPPPPSGPVLLGVDLEPVDSGDVLLGHKTTWRTPYERRAARHHGVDDVVLVNERGEITETTIANLAVRLDGIWWTPPVESGCLPGVERRRLLDAGALVERDLAVDDLYRAEAVALVSSVRGWRPAAVGARPGLAASDTAAR